MRIAVVVSTKDPAGLNIKENLLEQGFKETEEEFDGHNVCVLEDAGKENEAKLYTTDTDSIHCENIDKKIAEKGFNADMIIFATRHRAESGVKSLSVHSPGNWAKVEYGGEDRKLCVAPAGYLKAALLKLDEFVGIGSVKPTQPTSPPPAQAESSLSSQTHPPPPASMGLLNDFSVIQECTHHGPYVETPCMFIEIGSSEAEWKIKEAGKVIARTIIYLIKNKPKQCKTIFGIGGLHHTPEFSKITRRTDYAVGHVCPKYNVENLDAEMIKQALEKSIEKHVIVVLDWKGLKAGKENVVKMLEELNIDFKKTKELL